MIAQLKTIELTKLIAPSFYGVHHALKTQQYTHYWLKGGRGSTKSSFISVEIILGIMADPNADAMVVRKVKITLRESVFEQLAWAIEKLGVSTYGRSRRQSLSLLICPPARRYCSGGADDPKKIKSTKVFKGYFNYVWFKEVDEFGDMEEIRTINQTLLRGG
ncbi:phage terminase large subunit [Paenibacillus chitinolyticus]|uniref:phage terminase large subunit n=1 Tax=Paenibacillus chitinolyticus TaxID=79263 RepID=UPI0036DD70F0